METISGLFMIGISIKVEGMGEGNQFESKNFEMMSTSVSQTSICYICIGNHIFMNTAL